MAQLDTSAPRKASDLKAVYDGPRDIKDIAIKKDSLRLSGDGFFYTLQGEGPTLGYPAVFARLHHCNLACTWCDAFYTWDKRSAEFWTESWSMGFPAVADELEKLWIAETGSTTRERRVVWTGGEPLMQKRQIDKVMQLLWDTRGLPFWHPEIETNGTIMPTKLQLENYQFNVSPKLPSSGNLPSRIIKADVILALNNAQSTFKFVCSSVHDIEDIYDVYQDLIDEDKIIIMPEGVVEEEITKHARLLAPAVKEFGLKMTPRFQAIAFDGAKRGV